MKVRHYIAVGILALSAGALFVSCGFLGTSIDNRITSFVDSLNDDRTTTYENLVPGSAKAKANNGIATLWDAHFPPDEEPYTYTMISASPYTASDVELTITSDLGTEHTYKFVMQDEGAYTENWYIADIFVDVSDEWVSLF